MPENDFFVDEDSSEISLKSEFSTASSPGRMLSVTDVQARAILEKVETCFASLWEGGESAEISAIASYYEISEEEANEHIAREEFNDEIIEGRLTPRAALRLGLRLDNELGDRIRTTAIDVCQILSHKDMRQKIASALKQMQLNTWTDRRVAAFVGNVGSRNLVGKVRKELEEAGEIEPIETRKYIRKGKEQEQVIAKDSIEEEDKAQARSLGIPLKGLPEVPRNEGEPEQEMFPASYTAVHSIHDLAIAMSKLQPEDILSLFKKADLWFSDEQIEAVEQAIAHRRISKEQEWVA
jgi:hypothetical protein